MFGWLRKKRETREATPAELQLATIQGVTDFVSPMNAREAESYLPACLACIDYIGSSLASLPVRLCRYDGTKKEYITDHPVAELLKRPHPQVNGMSELLLMAMTDLLSYGNCIIVIDEVNERPVLTFVPYGYCVLPYRDYSAGYRITFPQDKTVVVPKSRVIHIRIGCTDGGFIGRSPLARNSATIGLSKVVEKATSSMWSNGVYPSVVLKTTKTFENDAQRTAARQSLIKQLGGENRGKPMFLDQDLQLDKMSVNSKELEHLDQRMLGIVQICMIFGVSPVLIGDLRFGTYSNYSSARQAWAQDGLSIYQRLFSSALTQQLVGDEPDMAIELDTSHLLQDRDSKVKEIIEMVKAGLFEDTDEAKRELGYG